MMTVTIKKSTARGTLAAPPSKSAAHRALICAGLAQGQNTVRGISYSEDVLATLDCLRALGAEVQPLEKSVRIRGALLPPSGDMDMHCRECGSTLRFFVPIALLCGVTTRLYGSGRLLSRPMEVYETICREKGFLYERSPAFLTVRGRLTPGEYTVRGDISSQFITGLLFALPMLEGESEITVLPPFESKPYVLMTLETLRAFGVRINYDGDCRFTVPCGQRYAPTDVTVEGDWSNAAFFDAFNTLGGDVKLTGLRPDSAQGDRVYRDYFTALTSGRPTLDLSSCPDLGPVCMALAAAHNGALFTGTRRLRAKESDRASCMAEELAKFGVRTKLSEDSAEIITSGLSAPTKALDGHNDHRIVMALSVLLTRTGGEIRGCEAVRKSFPDFFIMLSNLGIEVQKSGMDQ